MQIEGESFIARLYIVVFPFTSFTLCQKQGVSIDVDCLVGKVCNRNGIAYLLYAKMGGNDDPWQIPKRFPCLDDRKDNAHPGADIQQECMQSVLIGYIAKYRIYRIVASFYFQERPYLR